MNCRACSHENRDGAKFCTGCGEVMARACGNCGTELPEGGRFCDACGAPAGSNVAREGEPQRDGGHRREGEPPGEPRGTERHGSARGPARSAGRENYEMPSPSQDRLPRDYTPKHLADKILPSKSALVGERKQVTVLFADVKGSMELAEQIDPEAWHRILDRFFGILADGVHRFEGTVNQYTGDGIMALFGAPISHEDHAQRACYAALELRSALRDYADELRRSHGVSFSTRVGINSGEVIVGKIGDDLRMDYTAQGHTVGLAQRMESLAEPGSVFLTRHTANLVEGYFALRSLGSFDLKGSRKPLEVFELEGVGSIRTRLDRSRARGFSRFIGRAQELETLEGALEQAREGRGRAVGVVAEAGVGKSRLCLEFVESCRKSGVSVYEAHCPAHGKSVHLLPIMELMRGYFGITGADRDQDAREKIAGRLLLLDREFESSLPLVWEFLGVPDPERPAEDLDAEIRQRRLFAFVRQLVTTRSAREPAVLLIDDLHWVDPGSDAFIAQLVDVVESTRTLLLLNFRPEYRAEWMQRSYYQQLPLATLSPDDIQALAADLLGPDPSVSKLPERIAARTGGNPFYTEEVVQSLAESGQLEGERGSYRLVTPIDAIEVPETVQSILAARIDRLAEREKRVLQTASVIGKEFPESILREVADLPDQELHPALSALRSAEFLYEQALYPEPEYSFKHPLTHEVAYKSQLAERRRAVHAAVARAIEERDPERAKEYAALLAYHWDAADEVEPAALWHRRAALAVGAMNADECVRHWQRVRALADRLPPSGAQRAMRSEARSQLVMLASRSNFSPELDELNRLFEEACELGAQSDDPTAVTLAHIRYASSLLYLGREKEGAVWADRAVAEADRAEHRELRVAARYSPLIREYFAGDFERSIETSGEGLRLCDGDPGVASDLLPVAPYLFFVGMRTAVFAYLGRLADAQAESERLQEEKVRAHDYSFQITRCFRVQLHWLTGEFRSGIAQARESIEALGDDMNLAAGAFTHHQLGVALALVQEWEEARAALERSLEISRQGNVFLMLRPETLTWLGRVEAELGETDRGREYLEEALRGAERMGSRMPLALLHFGRARILWKERGVDAHKEIEEELATADRCARELGIRLYDPFVGLERAALRGAMGDEAGRRAQLEEVQRMFIALGSERNAERVARELSA